MPDALCDCLCAEESLVSLLAASTAHHAGIAEIGYLSLDAISVVGERTEFSEVPDPV